MDQMLNQMLLKNIPTEWPHHMKFHKRKLLSCNRHIKFFFNVSNSVFTVQYNKTHRPTNVLEQDGFFFFAAN